MFTPDTLKSYAAEIIITEQIHIQNGELPHHLLNDLKILIREKILVKKKNIRRKNWKC